jgi:hypothetical protein
VRWSPGDLQDDLAAPVGSARQHLVGQTRVGKRQHLSDVRFQLARIEQTGNPGKNWGFVAPNISSPGWNPETSGPTSSTMPDKSDPRINGNG